MNTAKHCNTCEYSYNEEEQTAFMPEPVLMQHCSSAEYCSQDYTHEMRMEDRKLGDYCRFWAPQIQKG